MLMIWSTYCFFSLLALACCWWLTANIVCALWRLVISVSAVVVCFMPVGQYINEVPFYAPCIAAIVVELIANGLVAAQPLMLFLLLALLVANTFALMVFLLMGRWRHTRYTKRALSSVS